MSVIDGYFRQLNLSLPKLPQRPNTEPTLFGNQEKKTLP